MSISTAEKNALNKLQVTITEVAQGYNDLESDVLVGDLIEGAGASGTLTLTSGLTTVVADTRIQAGDQVILQEQDLAAAQLADVFMNPATIVPGVSFTVTHANAAGTESYAYQISR